MTELHDNLDYEQGFRAGLESGLAAFLLNGNPVDAETQIRRLWKQSMMHSEAIIKEM